jgi:hypothetical protein
MVLESGEPYKIAIVVEGWYLITNLFRSIWGRLLDGGPYFREYALHIIRESFNVLIDRCEFVGVRIHLELLVVPNNGITIPPSMKRLHYSISNMQCCNKWKHCRLLEICITSSKIMGVALS